MFWKQFLFQQENGFEMSKMLPRQTFPSLAILCLSTMFIQQYFLV